MYRKWHKRKHSMARSMYGSRIFGHYSVRSSYSILLIVLYSNLIKNHPIQQSFCHSNCCNTNLVLLINNLRNKVKAVKVVMLQQEGLPSPFGVPASMSTTGAIRGPTSASPKWVSIQGHILIANINHDSRWNLVIYWLLSWCRFWNNVRLTFIIFYIHLKNCGKLRVTDDDIR